MKVGVSWHETLGPRTINFNGIITILFSIGYKQYAFYFAFYAEIICKYPFFCVILQCIQGVSAWNPHPTHGKKFYKLKKGLILSLAIVLLVLGLCFYLVKAYRRRQLK
jgi:hypothetical protein